MATAESAEALHQALIIRCQALRTLLRNLRGNLGMSWASLQSALELASDFPDEVEQAVAANFAQTSDPDSPCSHQSCCVT